MQALLFLHELFAVGVFSKCHLNVGIGLSSEASQAKMLPVSGYDVQSDWLLLI